MKKSLAPISILVGLLVLAFLLGPVMAPPGGDPANTIKEGEVTYRAGHYLAGEVVQLGFDMFGYNYQTHMFRGYYANSYLGGDGLPPYEGDAEAYLADHPEAEFKWYWPYRDVWLLMWWNDAWLSNKDRDFDGLLDRHWDQPSYIGSGAWLTNHQMGEDDGIQWEYFVKIVALEPGYDVVDGIVYRDDVELGILIWGQFVVVQRVYNEEAGPHGIEYMVRPTGFGAAG